MHGANDPATITLGLSMGSIQDVMGGLMNTSKEVLVRTLQMTRLVIVAGPIIVQCFFIHSVDFRTWLLRLTAVYIILGILCFIAVPEQLYTGLGLGALRWLFELAYPEMVHGKVASLDSTERSPALLAGQKVGELSGIQARLRWHGTNRYLCLTKDGWATAGVESSAVTMLLQHVLNKGKKLPDTYTFRISDQSSPWHHTWLSFQAVNQMRFGGWLAAYRNVADACPYKVIQDSSCPPGACKLLCAWPGVPPPSQRFCTGFYVAEQISGGVPYIGHAPDRDASLLELVIM